ncbi:MAG: hypothetical protein HOW73_01240 [Polyangiaceae bacterium]|nr:hypothetical protein [Polyangiaceae bacterium]
MKGRGTWGLALGFVLSAGCSDAAKGGDASASAKPRESAKASDPATWERHSVGGASAKFPKKPESKPQTIKRPEGDVKVEMLVVEGDDGNVYSLVASDYESELNPQAALDTVKTSWKSVKDKTLTEPKPVELAGLPGREISFTAKMPLGGRQRTFVDAKNGRIYTVDVVSNERMDPAVIEGFLGSLQIEQPK